VFIGAMRIAWSRGELRLWPFTPEHALTLLVVLLLIPYMVTLLVLSSRQVLKHLSIHRRIARFPDGLEYAHRVLLQGDDAWLSATRPYADTVADRLHGWSVRLMRVEEPLRTAALLLTPVLVVVGIILMAQGRTR
jgi:hypothetical protein